MKRNGNLTRQQILKSLKDQPELLRKYQVKRIGLFGSYATGKQTRNSDIDFLVDFVEPTFDNFIGLNSHLERLFKKKIDLITDGSLSPHIKPYVEKQIRWHQARGLNPIYYTEMADLVSIINSNWASFEDLLHDIDWVRQIFKSLERSRNVIMHSGQLSMDDIERVGVFIRDWLRQVGG
jgi:predicted nucleotidyltransferase